MGLAYTLYMFLSLTRHNFTCRRFLHCNSFFHQKNVYDFANLRIKAGAVAFATAPAFSLRFCFTQFSRENFTLHAPERYFCLFCYETSCVLDRKNINALRPELFAQERLQRAELPHPGTHSLQHEDQDCYYVYLHPLCQQETGCPHHRILPECRKSHPTP